MKRRKGIELGTWTSNNNGKRVIESLKNNNSVKRNIKSSNN
jgi:hypothetical protein